MFMYVLTLKHDNGCMKLRTMAQNKSAAIDMVMEAERCPRRAIIKTVRGHL